MSGMAPVIVGEWRKLRTIPTLWWLLVALVLVTVATTLLGFAVADLQNLAPNTGEGLKTGLHIVGLGSTIAEMAGIIGMAGEFRFGLADQTFLSTPRRGRVIAAKTVVYGLLGVVFGLVNAAVALVTAWAWLTADGSGLPFRQSLLWSTLGGGVVSATLFALIGVGVGAVLRNQVAAIVGVLVVQATVEPAVFGAASNIGRLLPSLAGEGLRQFPERGLLPALPAAAALAAWAILLVTAGHLRTRRADIA